LSETANGRQLLAVCPQGAHTASDGLIWPRVGRASITFPQRRSVGFLPLRDQPTRRAGTPISAFFARQESVRLAILLRCGRKRCGLIAPGWLIAIEAAMDAAEQRQGGV
jgi:hypothetical protein